MMSIGAHCLGAPRSPSFRGTARWHFAALCSYSETLPTPTVTQVGPGIWRVRIGEPEKLGAPSAYRSVAADTGGLRKLPDVATCPLNTSRIRSLASDRGLSLELPYDGEIIYGLGLQGDTFQQQGMYRLLMNDCTVLNQLGPGHASFPYYVNAQGYAVLVDTSRYVQMRIGTHMRKSHALEQAKGTAPVIAADDVNAVAEDAASDRSTEGKPFLIDIPVAHGVDLYVFAGPSMLNAVQRYNLYSGGGVLPPLWGLGVTFRMPSLASQDEVLSLARHFRERKLPFNVIGLEPGWHSKSYPCSFAWNTQRFDREALLAELGKMHYRLSLWEHPYVHFTSPYYTSLYEKSGDFAVFRGLVPDLADHEASAIYSGMHADLMSKGAAAFKIDANDNVFQKPDRVWPFPESTRFPSGLDGEQMHQLFGVLTQQAVMKPFLEANRRTYGETRCSGPYAAPYPFTLFSDMYEHADYFRMMVTGGFCGLLWQPEIRRGSNFDEYISRIQMAVFSPAVTFNNYMMPLPAWMQNHPSKNKKRDTYSDEEIRANEDVIRPLLEQRVRLIPYLYAAFKQYESEGLPPFRALALDYPDDPKCAAIDDQMLVGNALMGYVFLNEATQRTVYLPKGNWYDYNTGKKYTGGRVLNVRFDPVKLPLLVKEGSILPLANPVSFIDRETVFDVTCRVYGEHAAKTLLYEDDGETFDFKKGVQNRIALTWTQAEGGKIKRDDRFDGPRYNVIDWQVVP
jgi:alpha-D-xyloside xylohydrolase